MSGPPTGAFLARLVDIPINTARSVEVICGAARWSVIVVRDEAGVRGFENRCPHAGMPLDRLDGTVKLEAGFLVCAAHLASFDARDGAYAGGPKSPGSHGLKPVLVRIEDGCVYLA